MRRVTLPSILASSLFCWLFVAASCAQGPLPDAAPVNPNATPAARALLREIDSLSGHATLSGQHNFPNTVSRYTDRVYDLTGKYPALYGEDLGFSSDPDRDLTLGRAQLVEEVIRQYRNGAVIALTWHAVRPTDEEPVTFHGSVQNHLTDWEWKQLLTPGTDLYERWCRQVDLVAGYLLELQDAGVPVLFRPYHEMNGDWFWWGGRPGPNGSATLYRQLYDRLVHLHHLNNLVWVWNVNAPNTHAGPIEPYYPGPGFADVFTEDIYAAFEQRFYDGMVALAGPTHPIALAEVGTLPTLDDLARQSRWTYFMVWSSFEEGANTLEHLQAIYHAPNVISRGDPRLPAPLPPPAMPPPPVVNDAGPAAKALVARLYETRNKTVLSGQQIALLSTNKAPSGQQSAASVSALSAVQSTAGRSPALVEFTFDDPGAKPLLDAIRQAAQAGQIVLLRWMPPRPTDGALTGLLTDFEWQELLKPGTELNGSWNTQVDAAAGLLRKVQQEQIAVLWSPYPEPNAHTSWWAGRPGAEGSAAIVRMLEDRLTNHDGIHDLAWLWEAASPGAESNGNGSLADFYPGPLYCDALMLDVEAPTTGRLRGDRMLQSFGGGKPVGVRIAAGVPSPQVVDAQTGWQWIVLPATDAAAAQSLRDFYADPRVVSTAPLNTGRPD